MDFEQYIQKIAAINEELETIAEITLNQAWMGSANQSNPQFTAIMKQHKRLTDLSEKLTTQAANAFGM